MKVWTLYISVVILIKVFCGMRIDFQGIPLESVKEILMIGQFRFVFVFGLWVGSLQNYVLNGMPLSGAPWRP